DQNIVSITRRRWSGVNPVANLADVVPAVHGEQQAVAIALDVDEGGRITPQVGQPISHELLPIRLRLASGQDSQQGGAGGGNEMSSVHGASCGDGLVRAVWCRLKAAQASAPLQAGPALVTQVAPSRCGRPVPHARPPAS